MNKFSLSILAFAAALFGAEAAFGNFDVPNLTVGDTFTTEESLRVTSPLIGANGFVNATLNAEYEVVSLSEPVTQQFTGAAYTTILLESDTGTVNVDGQINASFSGITINGAITLTNGTYESRVWYNTTDFAVVKKQRVLGGTAQAELSPGFVVPIDLSATENEEYDPPLPEIPFPVASGDTGSPGEVTIYAFGDVSVPFISLSTDFDTNIALTPTYTVTDGTHSLTPTTLNTLDTAHTVTAVVDGTPVTGTLTTKYSCDASYIVDYSFSNIALPGIGELEFLNVSVVDYTRATDSCTQVTPTAAVSLALNANDADLNWAANDAVNVTADLTDLSGTGINSWTFVLADIFGALYFWPGAVDANTGFDYYDVQLAPNASGTITILDFPANTVSLGVAVPINWFFGVADFDAGVQFVDSDFNGNVAQVQGPVTTTLN